MVKLLDSNNPSIFQVFSNVINRRFLMQNKKKWKKELTKERNWSIKQNCFKINKLLRKQKSRNRQLFRNRKTRLPLTKKQQNLKSKMRRPKITELPRIRTILRQLCCKWVMIPRVFLLRPELQSLKHDRLFFMIYNTKK